MTNLRNGRLISFLIPFLIVGTIAGAFMWSSTLKDYPHFSVFSKEVVQLAAFSFFSSGIIAGLLGLAINWLRAKVKNKND